MHEEGVAGGLRGRICGKEVRLLKVRANTLTLGSDLFVARGPCVRQRLMEEGVERLNAIRARLTVIRARNTLAGVLRGSLRGVLDVLRPMGVETIVALPEPAARAPRIRSREMELEWRTLLEDWDAISLMRRRLDKRFGENASAARICAQIRVARCINRRLREEQLARDRPLWRRAIRCFGRASRLGFGGLGVEEVGFAAGEGLVLRFASELAPWARDSSERGGGAQKPRMVREWALEGAGEPRRYLSKALLEDSADYSLLATLAKRLARLTPASVRWYTASLSAHVIRHIAGQPFRPASLIVALSCLATLSRVSGPAFQVIRLWRMERALARCIDAEEMNALSEIFKPGATTPGPDVPACVPSLSLSVPAPPARGRNPVDINDAVHVGVLQLLAQTAIDEGRLRVRGGFPLSALAHHLEALPARIAACLLTVTSGAGRALVQLLAPGLFDLARYPVGRPVGAGAFGAVALVQGSASLAIKILQKSRGPRDASREAAAFAEVAALHRLAGDPSVTQLVAFGIDRQSIYLVLTAAVQNLRHWCDAGQPLASVLVRYRQALACVAAIHRHGVAHLDLAARNFLLKADGSLMLGDFGESHFGEPAPVSRGTEWIRPPEMLKGLAVGTRADIWQLGCLLFELCAGNAEGRRFLFLDSDWSSFYLHVTDDATPLLGDAARAALGADPRLAQFIEALLIRDPAKRPDAEEALRLFDEVFPDIEVEAN